MEWKADTYRETCGRVTEHGAKLVAALKELPCERVLDLGCGTGELTNDIAGFVREVIGIDSSPSMLEKAKAAYPKLSFFRMDACSLVWEDAFDAVFSNAVLHFISDQDTLLAGIYRALRKNGALVCEFGAAGNIAGLLDAVAAACAKRGKAFVSRFFYPGKEEYEELLQKHGFCVQSVDVYAMDTALLEGEDRLRNWVDQVFSVEMQWFTTAEREAIFQEIESALRPAQWDGVRWHIDNRRIRAIARKE